MADGFTPFLFGVLEKPYLGNTRVLSPVQVFLVRGFVPGKHEFTLFNSVVRQLNFLVRVHSDSLPWVRHGFHSVRVQHRFHEVCKGPNALIRNFVVNIRKDNIAWGQVTVDGCDIIANGFEGFVL